MTRKASWAFLTLRRRKQLNIVLSLCILVPLAVTYAFPLYWMITTSFKFGGHVFRYPPDWLPNPPTIKNYVHLRKIPIGLYIRNTSVITILATTGQVFSASLVAYGFAKIRSRLAKPLFFIVIATLLLPWPVLLIPQFIVFNYLGWVDTLLPLTVPHYLGGGAFNIFLIRQFMRGIPSELSEAATAEGAGHFLIYRRIMLPLTGPALATVAIFGFVAHWNDFMGPLIYLNTLKWRTLSLALHSTLQDYAYNLDWAFMMALATVAVVPTVILFFLAQKYFVQQLQLTGMKG